MTKTAKIYRCKKTLEGLSAKLAGLEDLTIYENDIVLLFEEKYKRTNILFPGFLKVKGLAGNKFFVAEFISQEDLNYYFYPLCEM